MPQISFTPKNQHVYDRFSRLLLEEQLKQGKLTAPQFLDLVLDGYEALPSIIEAFALKLAIGIVETQINTAKKVKEGLVNPDHIDPDTLADDWAMWIEQQFEELKKPVSLRAYIADAEANDTGSQQEGFVIRHKENHSYFVLDKRYAANPDAKFTFKQSEALVFDTEFEAEDFGFVNSHWLQEFEVAPLKPETE